MDAPSWATVPYVVTVLDLIPLILQDLYKPASVDMRFTLARWLELRAIRGAKHLLAISECTARDCHKLLGIPLDRITVTPLGVDDRFFGEAHPDLIQNIRAKYQLPSERPYLLYVGGIDERKNMNGLIRLYKLVHEAERLSNRVSPILVLAGKIEDDRNFPNLLALIRDNDLRDEVRCIGFVSDDDLLALYQGAAIFLFPSLYEGFGLPPLEALAAGVPVVSSNTSSLPEVLGDEALYFDPTKIDDGVSATIHYLRSSSDYLNTRRARGRKWARQYTWDETGRKTLSVYERFV
jgi:alpha-1,3-rhamnosyl/mannosyltransferase